MHARTLAALVLLCALLLPGAAIASTQRQAAVEAGCIIPGIKDGSPVYFRLDPCPEVVGAALPSPSPTAIPTVAPTAIPTVAPTATVVPTAAPTATVPPTATPTATRTATPVPPTPTVAPTATATVAPTATPAPSPSPGTGIVVNPGESIQAAVNSAPTGATVVVRAGVYAESVSVPRPITLAGEPGAILDGGCAATRTHGVTINNIPDVTVRGLEIRNYRGSGVQVWGQEADRIAVVGNDIHDFACAGGSNSTYAGASFYYSGSHQRVIGNTIRYRAAQPTRGGQNGVWFKSASGAGEASGGYHTVTDNVIVGGWDGIGGEGEDDAHGLWDGNATVLRNTVSDCWDDGISAEGFTGGSHFSDNTVTNCGIGIANASRRNSGEVRFERNVITSNAVGYYGNQACFKLGDGGTQTAYIVGNRCALTVGDGLAQTNAGISTLVVTDNVWSTGRYVYEITNLPGAGTVFDRNCLHTTDPTRFVKYGNVRYADLAAFRRATGQEANGRLGPCE